MSEVNDVRAKEVRRAPRWLWISFFLSLALNLVVLGAAVGAIWHFRSSKVYREAGAPRHFAFFLRRLDPDRRAVFLELFKRQRPELQRLRGDLRAARASAADAMAGEPFDGERFAAANRRLNEARTRLHQARSQILPMIAEKMTFEERQKFVEWRRRHWRRWRKWHHRD